MKKLIICAGILMFVISCKNEDPVEKEIAAIAIDVKIERFDMAFATTKIEGLQNLKATFPFMFHERIPDSVWIERINDTLQQLLSSEVAKKFQNLQTVENDIHSLFQHLKYYDNTFTAPRVVTTTSDVDYRNKTFVTDTIVLVSLDTYLGADHEFYEGIPKYITQNMDASQVVCDLAASYSEKYIFQNRRKTFLDEMIYYGKQLYFKDKIIPFKTDAEKIGYTREQLDWAVENEAYIWQYFIEREMLYSTDSSLPGRFLAPAPFSKFYLELDNESPGRLGQYIGWQIVSAYMKNNNVPFMNMLHTDAETIFNNSKFKPRK